MPELPPAIARRIARTVRRVSARAGCEEWEVALDGAPPDAAPALATLYTALQSPLQPGHRVVLNTTAVELSLGTGGSHFIIARLDEEENPAAFPGREAGHILKLRYTPLQLRVCSGEEEASPHREAVLGFTSLGGAPVLCAELLSQAGAAALAARSARPDLRIALALLDTAALPAAHSRLLARLRETEVLCGVVSTGQAFGGDVEAVNVYTGLILARAALRADLVIVSQGPGTVGTGTRYGFGGLALAEALHAGDTLGGRGILAPRISGADGRERHLGVSHHSLTILEVTRAPVAIPLPSGFAPVQEPDHPWPRVWPVVDPAPALPALEPFRDVLTTMGRGLNADPLFFQAAAAAGLYAAALI